MCNDLSNNGLNAVFQNKTGLILDAYFSGTKIKWILDSDKHIRSRAENGELFFGTIDTWLIWNLTNGKLHVTDCSNASRTLLFNIHNMDWDEELLQVFDIPKKILPKIVSNSGNFGCVDSSIFGAELPICGIAGYQQAALFGQMCVEPGDVKNTYGTGCFCMMNTGDNPIKSNNKMLTTVAWNINGKTTYAIEGSVFIGGALIQWLRDELNIVENSSDIEDLAKTVKDSGGVTFISALSGLGAPYWNPDAQGAIIGLTRDTKKGILQELLEAIAIDLVKFLLKCKGC